LQEKVSSFSKNNALSLKISVSLYIDARPLNAGILKMRL